MKFLKTKIGDTGYQSFINLTSKILGSFFTIGFIMFMSRRLSAQEMGIFSILNIFYILIGMMVSLGLGTAAVRLIPEYIISSKWSSINNLISTLIIMPLFFLIIIIVFVFLSKGYISVIILKSPVYENFIFLACIYAFLNYYDDAFLLIYQGLRNFEAVSFFYLFNVISQRLLALLLFLLGYELTGVFYGFILGSFFTLLIGLYSLRRLIHFRNIELSILKLSFPYHINSFARYGFSQVDQVLVGVWFKPEILGGYYIAKRIADVFRLIFDSIREPINVRLVQHSINSSTSYKENYRKSAILSIGLSIMINFTIIILAGPILKIFGGIQYEGYRSILVYAALVNMAFSVYAVINSDIFIKFSSSKYLLSQVFLFAISLPLQIMFAFLTGYNGLQIGQLVAYITWTIAVVLLVTNKKIEFALNTK